MRASTIRTLGIILSLAFLGPFQVRGAVPAIVHVVQTPNTGNGGQNLVAGGSVNFAFPEPTHSGNSIVVMWWAASDAGTMTVSDDQTNSYSYGPSCEDTNSAQKIFSAYVLNAAAGTRVMAVHTTNGSAWFQAVAVEVQNITALDVSSCYAPNSTMTTITAGSLTPTVTGDLIFQTFFNTVASSTTSITAGSQSNIAWALTTSDINNGFGSQWGVYNSTSSLNPTMTQGTNANDTVSSALAFKSGTSGSGIGTGMHIYAVHSYVAPAGRSNPITIQVPNAGNLLVDEFDSGTDCITSITSSPVNTWSATAACNVVANAVSTMAFYAPNPATTNGVVKLTIAENAINFDDNHTIFDVVGAAESPFDISAASGGNESSSTGNLNSVTITPSISNGLILSTISVSYNTVDATTTSGALLQNGFLSTNNAGNTYYYENNGIASYVNSSTDAITFGWSFMSGLAAEVGDWASQADAFAANSAALPAAPTGLTAIAH